MTRRAACVIPTLNEEAHIGALLQQLRQAPPAKVAAILVADGGSKDGTRDIVAAAALTDTRIRLVDNPNRLQAAGVNQAVRELGDGVDTIVRIDAHATYPDDFVERVLEAFDATGADMVAVRLRTRGTTCVQRAIAAVANSRIGSGGSAHRSGGRSGFVEHGHHAGMDRQRFAEVGGYDESFVANEDAELDHRVLAAGGRIWLANTVEIDYVPRASFHALLIQYLRYGRGRARTFLKHRARLRMRQLVPPAIVVALALSCLLSPAVPILLIIPALYAAALVAVTIMLFVTEPGICTLLAGAVMGVMHIAWGVGFLVTLLTARKSGRVRPSLGS